MSEGDAGFAEVVGGHLDIDLVADADADEVLAHFAGDVGENLVAVGQRDTKHGARQDLGHRPRDFDWFFFGQALNPECLSLLPSLLENFHQLGGVNKLF